MHRTISACWNACHGVSSNKIRRQRNLILDAGARTFDWLVAEGLKPIEARSGAVSRGMHDVLRVFAEDIGKARHTEFTDYERIDRALREGHQPMVFQEAYDLAPHMAKARKIAEAAVTAMKRVVQDGNDIDNVILAGGAMFFYRPVIQTAFARHKLHAVKDTLYANVIGFQWAGMESVRQEALEPGEERSAGEGAA